MLVCMHTHTSHANILSWVYAHTHTHTHTYAHITCTITHTGASLNGVHRTLVEMAAVSHGTSHVTTK